MSCISLSVGLGNIWRFPFTAVIFFTLCTVCSCFTILYIGLNFKYENGGGAFLIPYFIVLLLIGKPLYFLEMVLGQFTSRGSVQIWTVVPIVKGKWMNCYVNNTISTVIFNLTLIPCRGWLRWWNFVSNHHVLLFLLDGSLVVLLIFVLSSYSSMDDVWF